MSKKLLYLRRLAAATSLLLIGCGLSVRTVSAQTPTPPTALDQKTREDIFEIVWSRINDGFFDPKFHGVDWGLMRRRYGPQASQAKTDAEFYEILDRMLSELKQSHIGIIPPEAYADDDKATESKTGEGAGTAGLVVQWVEDKPVITRVTPRSAADVAGLKPGFILTAIGDRDMATILGRLRQRSKLPRDFNTIVRIALPHLLDGPVGSEITVKYLDAADMPQTAVLKRTPIAGQIVRFGQLPPLPVEVEKRILPGGVGYIRANIFLFPILEPIRAAIKEMHAAPAILFDLRGNPGGIGALANSIAGSLFSEPINLGTMKLRKGFLNFPVNPQPPIYKGKVIVLTDEGSVSTSEIFAGGLQETGRATVIGEQTAGQVLPSVVEILPGGARLQFATADFRTPKGILLEGRGVTPNIVVPLTRKQLLTGEDPVINAALTYLKTIPTVRSKK